MEDVREMAVFIALIFVAQLCCQLTSSAQSRCCWRAQMKMKIDGSFTLGMSFLYRELNTETTQEDGCALGALTMVINAEEVIGKRYEIWLKSAKKT